MTALPNNQIAEWVRGRAAPLPAGSTSKIVRGKGRVQHLLRRSRREPAAVEMFPTGELGRALGEARAISTGTACLKAPDGSTSRELRRRSAHGRPTWHWNRGEAGRGVTVSCDLNYRKNLWK